MTAPGGVDRTVAVGPTVADHGDHPCHGERDDEGRPGDRCRARDGPGLVE